MLRLVWSAQGSVTVTDVHTSLEEEGRELAYSTDREGYSRRSHSVGEYFAERRTHNA